MATFLFEAIIFGPVKSRRLGNSLGVNLLPETTKMCNYNCIYCECGWTKVFKPGGSGGLHSRQEIQEALEAKLKEMKKKGEPLDVITFAGNGEPTMHPEFPQIIDDTLKLRDTYFPDVKVSVLSNAAYADREEVFRALKRVDLNILKLDSAKEASFRFINRPAGRFSLDKLVQNLKLFNGDFILQTLFLRGEVKGRVIDNTTNEEVEAWLNVLREINPAKIMVYTFARDTPVDGLQKITAEELKKIALQAELLGFDVEITA